MQQQPYDDPASTLASTLMSRFGEAVSSTYARALLVAMAIWSIHFWALGAAVLWLPLKLAALSLPVLMGSAVFFVLRLERRAVKQTQRFALPTITQRREPQLPQPHQGWAWHQPARLSEPRATLAQSHLHREAA